MVKSDKPVRTIGCPTGDGYEYYDEKITDSDTGEITIKKRRVHIYAMIQAASKTCDMNYIIAQLKKGDTSVLEDSKGVYIDATQLPHDLGEAIEMSEKAKSLYESNEDLKSIYKTSDDYEKALFGGEDIVSKLMKYRLDKIESLKKVSVGESDTTEKGN